jgi:glycosyltransferase involved in cell wall biosynthesis
MEDMDLQGSIRLVAIMEAASVTGPAKNLIEFCRNARQPDKERPDLPVIHPSVTTFVRGRAGLTNDFVSAVSKAGLDIETIPERFRFDPQSLFDLRARIVQLKPDLVQTHNVKSHFLFRLSGLHRRFPWIAFHHGYTTTDQKMRAYNQLDRWSLGSARCVITVCGPFSKDLQQAGVPASKIRVLHNSVRLPVQPTSTVVQNLRQRLNLPSESPVILAVGRFSHEKGHVDLIGAFAILRKLFAQDVRLVLVGDGPERGNLQSAVQSAGLSQEVIFAGQVSDVQPFYAMSAALALPSLSEGSPNVVLEAMAAGLPIAATAVGGVPELLENEVTGLLVPPADPPALASALHRLLADPALTQRLTSAASALVTQSFTPEFYRRSLLEIYREMVR